MTSALRLATLSYAIAYVDASLLLPAANPAGNWGAPEHTFAAAAAAAAAVHTVGWTPKPTAPLAAEPRDYDLRKRQQDPTTATTTVEVATCGYLIDNKSAPAISCDEGAYCFQSPLDFAAGCCTERNRRNCRIPTTCIESTRSQSQSTRSDSRTLLCDDPARPRCVTYLYNANFPDNLNGVSFLACGLEAGSSTIATSPPPGWTPTSATSSSAESTSDQPSTGGDPTNAVTVTVFPSATPSPSGITDAEPSGTAGNRTAAIVGGVVGGVAGLALIIAAILFCLRRRRKEPPVGKEMENSPPFPGRDFPRNSVYHGGLPEPQYQSDYYGELPLQMAQPSPQPATGYQPPTLDPVVIPRNTQMPARQNTFVPRAAKPSEDDIVSPITPGDQLNPADDPSTYTWISNPTPPPQSEYSQFSPPPPAHFQSYRPYPGT